VSRLHGEADQASTETLITRSARPSPQLAELVRGKAPASTPKDTPLFVFPEFERLSAANVHELAPSSQGALHALVLGNGAPLQAAPRPRDLAGPPASQPCTR
jgi:hypothetical protein